MKRIERDPEPWEYSEANFIHLQDSLRRAEAEERHNDQPAVNWSAVRGAVIGTSISLAFWWAVIYGVLWIKGWR